MALTGEDYPREYEFGSTTLSWIARETDRMISGSI